MNTNNCKDYLVVFRDLFEGEKWLGPLAFRWSAIERKWYGPKPLQIWLKFLYFLEEEDVVFSEKLPELNLPPIPKSLFPK
jgi:hypothetical protein